jgi:hypothetical protein
MLTGIIQELFRFYDELAECLQELRRRLGLQSIGSIVFHDKYGLRVAFVVWGAEAPEPRQH